VYGRTAAGGIISDLTGQVQKSRLCLRDIQILRRRHLNAGLLRQLVEAGPNASFDTLQALVGGSQGQINQINSLQNMLGNIGTVAGRGEANALYGRQIRATENLIRSLRSEERAVDRLERKLGGMIVRDLHVTITGGDAPTIIRKLDQYLHVDVARALRSA
jgi:hypothetical protein